MPDSFLGIARLAACVKGIRTRHHNGAAVPSVFRADQAGVLDIGFLMLSRRIKLGPSAVSQMKVNSRLGMMSAFLEDSRSSGSTTFHFGPFGGRSFRLLPLSGIRRDMPGPPHRGSGALSSTVAREHDPPKKVQNSMNHCTSGSKRAKWLEESCGSA